MIIKRFKKPTKGLAIASPFWFNIHIVTQHRGKTKMSNPYEYISLDDLYKKLDNMKIGNKKRQEVKREINNRVKRFSRLPEPDPNNPNNRTKNSR